MTTAVNLSHVSCIFASGKSQVRAVDGVSLDVRAGEFFTLLGPSGSGKTTCLRMIGGFTLPTAGTITINGQDVSLQPPYARPVNTVFQDYALFPHMTVLDNVAYSQMVKGVPKATREAKAMQLLETVQLPEIAQRKPGQLSGGQRQRVALARALISEPQVLLLDEPLGALDLKLREQMQSELKTLQRQLGITFIFVTHDQHEALSMSDRIGIFNKGKLEQVATPQALYDAPSTRFVAEFVGAANLLEGEDAMRLCGVPLAMIRPERIHLSASQGARTHGTAQEVQYFGTFWRVRVAREGTGSVLVEVPVVPGATPPVVGEMAHLHWSDAAVHTLTP